MRQENFAILTAALTLRRGSKNLGPDPEPQGIGKDRKIIADFAAWQIPSFRNCK